MLTSIEKKITDDSVDIGNGILYQINESGAQLFQDGKLVDSLDNEKLTEYDNLSIEYTEDTEARFVNEVSMVPPVGGINLTGEFNGNNLKKEEDKKKITDITLARQELKAAGEYDFDSLRNKTPFKDVFDKAVNKVKAENPKEENALGGMLPQAGLNGEPIVGDGVDSSFADRIENEVKTTPKKTEENGESMVELFGDLDILTKESVFNYIENVDSKYDEEVEESVQDIILNMKTKIDIKRHIRKLIITNAIMKCKLATMTRFKADNSKIIELKREIVKVQKELNDLQKNASAAEKLEIKRIQKEAEKEVAKEAKRKKKEENKEVSEAARPIDAVDTGRKVVKEEPKKKKDAVKERLAENGKVVPKTCDKCGAKVGLYVKGEPVWVCSNKKCGKYFGTLAFTESESILDEYEFQKERATLMYECTGEVKYENMVKGYTNKINSYTEEECNHISDSGSYMTESVASNIAKATSKAMRDLKKKNKKEIDKIKDKLDDIAKKSGVKAYTKDDVKKIKSKRKDIKNKLKSKGLSTTERHNLEAQMRALQEHERMVENMVLQQQFYNQQQVQQQNMIAQQMAHQAHVDAVNAAAMSHQMATGMPVGPIMCSADDTDDDMITEARDMEDEIRPIVDSLENKGYMVKYASPGHKKLRKKEDKEPDGVYYNHLYSDARIMFDKKYNFKGCPKGWTWRDVDGCSYLDIIPKKYSGNDNETPDEAFAAWKKDYMKSLKGFVDDLDSNKSGDNKEKETNESVDFYGDMMDALFEKVEEK